MATQTAPAPEMAGKALRDRIHRIFSGDVSPAETVGDSPAFWVEPTEDQKGALVLNIHVRIALTDKVDSSTGRAPLTELAPGRACGHVARGVAHRRRTCARAPRSLRRSLRDGNQGLVPLNQPRAGEPPVMPLRQTSWFRSVEQQYQYEPPHVRCSMTRFNSGNVRVIYFAPDPLLARFEARDILGQWFGDATPTFRDRHVVVEYRIDLAPRPVIVDAPPPPPPPAQLPTVDTTVQEMTGDWHS